jgi:hypothetical protein
MAARRKKYENNRNRYKCINVDHETYRIIYGMAKIHRRSLVEQLRVMASAEKKKQAELSMFSETEEEKKG